ncbi:GNAT family N-acetyltransferase [Thiolinea disciformis]|uniref:GNAT family N-acetyltransferase n=1 Tax=Thiolinea disciformis TaxID=125614 RepID=UPI00037826E3|nr:GNAT family protein [Thiolinea disciformis]
MNYEYGTTLYGSLVRLEPLSLQHMPDLLQAAQHESLWRYMFYGNLAEPHYMQAFIVSALQLKAAGSDMPFAVIEVNTGRAIGSTRFRDICMKHLKLEIGGTWYAPDYHRTGVNLECKYLLLRYAFESLGMLRVQFKTDVRNQASRQSLEKLGASLEGILRRSAVMPDGVIRDTAVYSILDTEWGELEGRLRERLQVSRTPVNTFHSLGVLESKLLPNYINPITWSIML